MPSPHPILRTDDAVRFIEERCFPPAETEPADAHAANALRAGVEVEWLTAPLDDPDQHLDAQRALELQTIAGQPSSGSRVTLEPGGQIELSSPAAPAKDVCALMAADATELRRRLAAAGVGLRSLGLDPTRPPRRVLQAPRYVAMERFFDRYGPDGRSMMCATASVQVNLDLGTGQEQERRWRLANLVGPVLSAAFANSPFREGAPSGWRSSRAAVWRQLDLSRTSPVPQGPAAGTAANAWARYALNAQVMLVRQDDGQFVPGLDHLTFGAWMAKGHALGFPDTEDLAYHLTTLFPPVRPRGWLELRFIDALPEEWWRVPMMVSWALVTDPDASQEAEEACAPVATLWVEAARHGLAHPALAAAATRCFRAAQAALPRSGAERIDLDAVDAFLDRYVSRGRTPADDALDHWAATGTYFPTDHPLEAAWL